MAKRFITVLFVVLLMVCLAVFSYADLPSNYTQLEYIQSSGTQYIDTGFTPNQDTRVVMDIYNLEAMGGAFFGVRLSSSSFSYCLVQSLGQFRSDYYGSTISEIIIPVPSTVGRFLIDKNKNICTVNDTTVSNATSTFSCRDDLLLFTFSTGGTVLLPSSIMRLYSCQIYDNGTLVRDFIPCANPLGVVGLWDDVNSVFYDNDGSGTFIAGPLVNPPEPEYSISVSSDGNGSVSSSVSTATAGTTVTLTATPAANYVFSEWQVLQGDIDIVNNQFIMPSSNVSVKAIFVPDGTHSVTVENDGNGVGSANPVRAEQGTRITLSAVPVLGYEFDSWEVLSGAVNISNNQFIMPDSDVVVRAKFKPIVYTITLNQGSNGSATVSQTTGIIGDVITLTATPDDLYSFSHWDVTQGGITVENNQFVMPASDVVLTPVFIKQTAVSSGYTFNSGVHDDSDITARQGVADISFGELPAGEYLINIYSYGQNYGVSYDIGVGSDTTRGRKLPYTQSGGVTTALYTHSGGEMVLDLNFTYYKSVLNSPRSGSDVITGNWYEGTGALTGVITSWVVSSSNWIFNIIDVTATPVGLANSEDYGIYAGIISFLRDKFDDLISVFGSEEAEEDVGQAQESLDKEVEELGQLSADLTEQSSNLEQQFNTDFAVPDEVTGSTSSIQAIYNFLFSSLGIFSIFIWLPVVLAVIRKLLRL